MLKAIYDRDGITIYRGNCLDVMPCLPEHSVDCVCADLPYGATAAPWDSAIPLEPLWEQYQRLLKNYGAIVLTASQPFTSALVMSNPKWFKYEWIWEKGRASGFVHVRNKPLKAHENVLVFSNGTTVHAKQSKARMLYNPQMADGEPYRRVHSTVNSGKLNHAPSKANLEFVGSVTENTGQRYPRSVLFFSQHNVGTVHPVQKPLALFQYLIRTYTYEGDLVLDNTMGSGTTLVAAKRTGRRAIGIEISDEYCEKAIKRLEAEMLPLFADGV